jgi:hypothetical protein
MSHNSGVGCEGEGRFGMAAVSVGRSELRHVSAVASHIHCKAMRDANSSSLQSGTRHRSLQPGLG